MTLLGRSIERELAIVKVHGAGDHRVEALRLSDAFKARVIDATLESFVFELTGASSKKIDQFVNGYSRSLRSARGTVVAIFARPRRHVTHRAHAVTDRPCLPAVCHCLAVHAGPEQCDADDVGRQFRFSAHRCRHTLQCGERSVLLFCKGWSGSGLARCSSNIRGSIPRSNIAGAAYLLWLAWQDFAHAAPANGEDEPAGKPLSFFGAALFQWVNVKGLIVPCVPARPMRRCALSVEYRDPGGDDRHG